MVAARAFAVISTSERKRSETYGDALSNHAATLAQL
jgi:hypothetical protein